MEPDQVFYGFAVLLGVELGHQKKMRSLKLPGGFTQSPPGKKKAIPQRIFSVEEYDIQISLEFQVLKPIVQNYHFSGELPVSIFTQKSPIFTGQYRHAGQLFRQQKRLIPRFIGAQHHLFTI